MSQFRLTYLCLYGLEHYQVKAYRSLSGGLRCSGKLRNATEGAVCSRDIRLYARPMSRMCSPELSQLYTFHLFCQGVRCAGPYPPHSFIIKYLPFIQVVKVIAVGVVRGGTIEAV